MYHHELMRLSLNWICKSLSPQQGTLHHLNVYPRMTCSLPLPAPPATNSGQPIFKPSHRNATTVLSSTPECHLACTTADAGCSTVQEPLCDMEWQLRRWQRACHRRGRQLAQLVKIYGT